MAVSATLDQLSVATPAAAAKAIKPRLAWKAMPSGFANGTVWLIFGAFTFALGYDKTGLGRRIALHLVRKMEGAH